MKPIAKAHQNLTFTTPPNLQRAVAIGLGKDDAYFATLAADLQRKRDRLADAPGGHRLRACCRPTAPTSSRPISARWASTARTRISAATSREAGVTAVPVSAFYDEPERRPAISRAFAFCKHDATLDSAIDRLSRHFSR